MNLRLATIDGPDAACPFCGGCVGAHPACAAGMYAFCPHCVEIIVTGADGRPRRPDARELFRLHASEIAEDVEQVQRVIRRQIERLRAMEGGAS